MKRKSTTGFVSRIKREIKIYAELKRLVDRRVELATELSDLKLRSSRAK